MGVIGFPSTRDVLAGAAAGLLATVPQTVAMQAVRLAVPGPRGGFPPRQVTEAVLARLTPGRRRPRLSEPAWWVATAACHFGFGAAAGAAYPAVVRPGRSRGLLYGLAVGFLSYAVAMPAVGIRLPESDRPVRKALQLIAAHLAWGLSLGVIFQWLTTAGQPEPPDTRQTNVLQAA